MPPFFLFEEIHMDIFSAYLTLPEKVGLFMVARRTTLRSTAKFFHRSKSTIHLYVTVRLKEVNPDLYNEVRELLDYNKSVRHIRGGLATKQKYS